MSIPKRRRLNWESEDRQDDARARRNIDPMMVQEEQLLPENYDIPIPEQVGGGRGLSGTKKMGGTAGGPLQTTADQGINNMVNHVITYSGTTYVHSATHRSTIKSDPGVEQTDDNCWTKIPWEFMQGSITKDEAVQIQNRFMKWKATKVTLEIMNPTVIQEVGANIAQAGLNTNVNLYGYKDDNLLLGWEDQPGTDRDLSPNAAQKAYTDLAISWKTNGILDGVPIYCPNMDVSAVRLWDSTHPSVRQISCSQGDSMRFEHHIKSPYWRSTEEFTSLRYMSVLEGVGNTGNPVPGLSADLTQHNWIRWDENQGAVGELTVPKHSVNSPTDSDKPTLDKASGYEWDIRNFDRQLNNGWARRGPYGILQNLSSTDAQKADVQTVANGPPPFMLYIDSDPIPSVWLQLQPQANGANGTIASSCQVQFKISIQLILSGCVPAVGKYYEETETTDALSTIQIRYKQYGNSNRRILNHIPWYRPLASDHIRFPFRLVEGEIREQINRLKDRIVELEAKAPPDIPKDRMVELQAQVDAYIQQQEQDSD